MAKKRSSRGSKATEGDGHFGEEDVMESTLESKTSSGSVSNRIVICKNPACRDVSQIGRYCRLHYLANWRKEKSKEAKDEGSELENYLKQLRTRFPEEFFEKLRAEVEELVSDSSKDSGDSDSTRSPFDSVDSDQDMDTIIKGIRVEDF